MGEGITGVPAGRGAEIRVKFRQANGAPFRDNGSIDAIGSSPCHLGSLCRPVGDGRYRFRLCILASMCRLATQVVYGFFSTMVACVVKLMTCRHIDYTCCPLLSTRIRIVPGSPCWLAHASFVCVLSSLSQVSRPLLCAWLLAFGALFGAVFLSPVLAVQCACLCLVLLSW